MGREPIGFTMLSLESQSLSYRTYACRMDNVREKRALGSRIQAVRAERGVSQRQLALMTGTSRSYLWKIEIGAADVGLDVLIRIARALDVPVRELIEF